MVDCRVVSETPAGMGFGSAAIAISKLYKVNMRGASDSIAEGRRVPIPIRFALP